MAQNFRQAIIAYAKGEIGTTESPRNSNRVKYWEMTKPSWNGYAWCGAFTTACYLQAGIDIRHDGSLSPYYCPSVEAFAKKIGAWKTSGNKPGDLVLYGFGRPEAIHIGISYPDMNASGYRAIEGNTSKGSAGSQSNGGGVYLRYRGRDSIRGWVDMDKLAAHFGVINREAVKAEKLIQSEVVKTSGTLNVDKPGFAREDVREIQARLKTIVPDLEVDGIWGKATTAALQAYYGTPRDGFMSGQSSRVRDAFPALNRSAFRVGRGGSTVVKRLQADVGVTPDGKLGNDTARATKLKLNRDKRFLAK